MLNVGALCLVKWTTVTSAGNQKQGYLKALSSLLWMDAFSHLQISQFFI